MLVNVADEVCTVSESGEAEQAFRDFAPDLVLLDLRMPSPDGVEILRRLRRDRDRARFPPVIVLIEEERSVAKSKPLDRQEVVLRVRNHLRTRHLLEEIQRATGGQPT